MLVGGTTRLRQPVHEPRASTGAASSAAAGNRTAVTISSPTRRRRQLAPRFGLSAGCAWSAVKASGTILPPDLVSRRWGRGETRMRTASDRELPAVKAPVATRRRPRWATTATRCWGVADPGTSRIRFGSQLRRWGGVLRFEPLSGRRGVLWPTEYQHPHVYVCCSTATSACDETLRLRFIRP